MGRAERHQRQPSRLCRQRRSTGRGAPDRSEGARAARFDAGRLGRRVWPNVRFARADAPREPADGFGGFTVGVQSYSYRQFTLERALEQIQMLGLRSVEFYRGHVATNATEAQIMAVRNLCEKHRITPIAFGVENFSKDHD